MHETSKASFLLAILLTTIICLPTPGRGQIEGETVGQKLALGVEALRSDDLETAATAFREVLATAPENELALLGLSEVLERQTDLVAALAMAQRASEAAPQSAAALLAVGRLQALLGLSDQALASLERCRSLAPDEVESYQLSSIMLRDLGRRDDAIQLLELALERDLHQPHLETELAMLLVAADRPDEARQRAEDGLAKHGETAGLQLALGLAIANDSSADRADAVPYLESALALGVPDPSRVQLELGSILLESDRPDEAVEHLTRAAELMPESPDVHYQLGVALRATGDAEGARESLARFQELKAQNEKRERLELEVGTALNEAQSLATANRLPEALQQVDSILAVDPDEARVHTLRAKILYSLRRPEQALAAIQRSRELDSTRIEPHYLEGMFLLQLNRPADAATALRQAVSLDPGLGEAYALLGGAAAKMEQPGDAAAYFQRALDLGFDGPSLRLGYAAALESLGRPEESAEQDAAYRRLVERPQ